MEFRNILLSMGNGERHRGISVKIHTRELA
jgi:hypothetical protein